MGLVPVVLVAFAGAVYVSATGLSHDFHYTYGCYESGELHVDAVVDGDVARYADFSKGKVVWTMPHAPQAVTDFGKPGFEIARAAEGACRSTLLKAKLVHPGVPLRRESPSTSIHTRYEGEEGVLNTLFCMADHFYPPSLNFTWTQNEVEVTEGVTDLRYRHNADGTFSRISTLRFAPRDGVVYTCTMQHEALQQPLTRSWELRNRKSGVSPAAVFLGVSLLLCLIGIGTGAFFFSN